MQVKKCQKYKNWKNYLPADLHKKKKKKKPQAEETPNRDINLYKGMKNTGNGYYISKYMAVFLVTETPIV